MENGVASSLSHDLLKQQKKRKLYNSQLWADGDQVHRHNGALLQVARGKGRGRGGGRSHRYRRGPDGSILILDPAAGLDISQTSAPYVKGVIAKRPLPPHMQSLFQQFANAQTPCGGGPAAFRYQRCCSMEQPSPGTTLPSLHTALSALIRGLPHTLAPIIAEDAVAITRWLVALTGAPEVTLQLEVVGWNKCGRWHQDNYVGRVAVTYGDGVPGTWFVDDSNVNFRALEQGGLDADNIVREPSRTWQAEAGDICLIKGQKWGGLRPTPGAAKWGAVHRSPDVALYPDGRLPNRLLLKVDCDIEEDSY